jgi:probable F420-dependent oxidoreductase
MNGQSRKLEFGCLLYQDGLTFPEIRQIAQDCEELGFTSLWLKDSLAPWIHLYLKGWPETPKPDFLECLTTLSALAATTDKLRLGAILCNTFRNPALVAKTISTLDIISEGRIEFGLSAGWNAVEHEAYGINFLPAKDRVTMLEESLEIIKRMWTQSKTTFHGRFHSVKNAVCEPKPLQQPHPPIWVGGAGLKTLKLTAKFADGWNYGLCPPEFYVSRLKALREFCNQIGREPSSIKKAWQGIITSSGWQDVDQGILDGSPHEITQKLRQLVDLGVDYFTLHFTDRAILRTFAREVMAHLP